MTCPVSTTRQHHSKGSIMTTHTARISAEDFGTVTLYVGPSTVTIVSDLTADPATSDRDFLNALAQARRAGIDDSITGPDKTWTMDGNHADMWYRRGVTAGYGMSQAAA